MEVYESILQETNWFIGHLSAALQCHRLFTRNSPPGPSLFQLVSSSKCCQSHSSVAVFMLQKGCCHMITMLLISPSGGDLGFLLSFPSAARDKTYRNEGGSCCDRNAGGGDYCDRCTCFLILTGRLKQPKLMAWWEAARKTVYTHIDIHIYHIYCLIFVVLRLLVRL